MLQDSWRYSFFALGKGSKAFVNDTIWTVVPRRRRSSALRFVHHQTVFWFVLVWGADGQPRRRHRHACRHG